MSRLNWRGCQKLRTGECRDPAKHRKPLSCFYYPYLTDFLLLTRSVELFHVIPASHAVSQAFSSHRHFSFIKLFHVFCKWIGSCPWYRSLFLRDSLGKVKGWFPKGWWTITTCTLLNWKLPIRMNNFWVAVFNLPDPVVQTGYALIWALCSVRMSSLPAPLSTIHQ